MRKLITLQGPLTSLKPSPTPGEVKLAPSVGLFCPSGAKLSGSPLGKGGNDRWEIGEEEEK